MAVGATALPASRAEAAVAPARPDLGVSAYPFAPGQVQLTASRWLDNQNRTLNYLRFVDADRVLYNFRANHRLSTNGAAANGGWDAPNFPFRTHMQGHLLTAWAQAAAVLADTTCRDRATYVVGELARCQANNGAAGFTAGYLSGFPESDFTSLESGSLSNGNVPYYVIHKTMAGLLDVWRYLGNTQARDVLLNLAGWVDWRTGRLSYSQMQSVLNVEFGGMNAVLTDLYQQTGDGRWLTTAQRFDHAAVFNPLASNQDQLNGLHANTQVPKWVGAAREYKATGTTRYRDIAANAWAITVGAHTYAIGGNSQAEHFRAPNAIAGYLNRDTCEHCNSYNMLKLTRELFTLYPGRVDLVDFYERTLLNHIIGAQNPADSHGHITYFTPLNPGGRRGVGPAWGGGTWSTDYNSFWCCQGTGVEANTALMDSVYFYSGTTLIVNLFMPSVLTWAERGITVTQTTSYPVSDRTTLKVTGAASGPWAMRLRIPAWTSGATISVNGVAQDITLDPGSYATLSRSWTSGDTVTLQLPMRVATRAANDNPNVAAVTYGPVVLAGHYGDASLSSLPSLTASSVTRSSTSSLAFTASANGAAVNLAPFYDAQGYNYTVYWSLAGGSTPTGYVKIANVTTGLVLDSGGSVGSGSVVKQWSDVSSPNLQWQLVDAGGGYHRVVNRANGMVVDSWGNATNGASALQAPWNGGVNQQWRLTSVGNGRYQLVNRGTGTALDGMGNATVGSTVCMWAPNGSTNNHWTVTAL
ncbi:beta-L-arabinofuranosidase domain-containing protein [Micromonospora sp. MA102]|uniref:beta-L-arabinofuranosidase domain-containing protein n=1 Tax=Micromonospora sp. MA102 TaxID=2952755 RepID=UPI0021C8D7EA|nr:beta-L-arabinofuranosidase domain-containing protein [Micromonospora sp. MA102]